MTDYEIVCIINPEIGEEKVKKTVKKAEELIASLKGKVEKTTDWGKRELAYPIKKLNQGSYFLLVAKLSPDSLKDLSKKLKLEEDLLRYLIVKKESR